MEGWEDPEVVRALAGVAPPGARHEVSAALGAPSTSDAVVPHTEDSQQSLSSMQQVPDVEPQPKHAAAMSAKYAASKAMRAKQQLRASSRRAPGVKALQEIRRYQSSSELLIRRAPFARVIPGNLYRLFVGTGRRSVGKVMPLLPFRKPVNILLSATL